MKFLIGVLILLFVLTTIGFSQIAYAQDCTAVFEDHSATSFYEARVYESREGWNEFNTSRSPYFLEPRERIQNDRDWNEFETPRNDNEFHINDNF